LRGVSDSSLSDSTSEGSDNGLGTWEDEVFLIGDPEDEEEHLILHPTKFTYARNFNPFAGQPLLTMGTSTTTITTAEQ